MADQGQLFIDGEWVDGESSYELLDKFDGTLTARIQVPSQEQVGQATRSVAAEQAARPLPPYDRFTILARASRLLEEQRDSFARTVVADSGLTITDARREVDRAVQTLLLCGEEAKRIVGEVVPVSGAPNAADRIAFTTRHPIGVVCAITPFNAPLNTVCHKVGPALAAGNGVVLKPAAQTPLTSERLVRLLLEAGLPERLVALLQGPGSTVGEWLLQDPRPGFYAFTGSTSVGEHIHRTVGLRRTQLELGSLSSTIVCDDAGLQNAATLCVNAAFRKSGQVCTSIQRLYVQRPVMHDFAALVVEQLKQRSAGDPTDDDTFVGPLITMKDAERVESWVDDAVDRGAGIAYGGVRVRQVVEPTVLTDVTTDMDVMSQEIFGPVVSLRPFDDLDEAIAEANDTPYGLAAGIFTRDINRALTAAARLRVGSVHINETSSSRLDLMPYGGVKLSGHGKEGPRYAIAEMSEERLVSMGRTGN